MKRKHHNISQNSPEWDGLRLGRFTTSMFKDLFMSHKTAGYEKAIYSTVYEKIYGESPDDFYYGDYMERGHKLEPYAIECYEMETFDKIDNGGFWTMGEWLGSSPDGLIGKEGLFESKAPAYNTMMNYLIKDEVPKIYHWQVHGQLQVVDRVWCDFMAYHPKMKPLIKRVYRDEKIENQLVEKQNEAIEKAQEVFHQLSKEVA